MCILYRCIRVWISYSAVRGHATENLKKFKILYFQKKLLKFIPIYTALYENLGVEK